MLPKQTQPERNINGIATLDVYKIIYTHEVRNIFIHSNDENTNLLNYLREYNFPLNDLTSQTMKKSRRKVK